jgi:rod shape determining protein RodA
MHHITIVHHLFCAFNSQFSLITASRFRTQLCKIFVNLALAKYLSRIDTDFTKLRSQLIATAIVMVPAIITILQSETGWPWCKLFFLVMYREGLPSIVLVVGFSLAVLVIATLLIEPNLLAILLTAIAVLTIYLMRRQVRRDRSLLIGIAAVWFICVGIQRFAVPFFFNNVLKPYQVQRIYATVGRDFPVDPATMTEEDIRKIEDKKKASTYNVKQSTIAIGSGGFLGKGLLKGTQTRYDFVPEQRTDFIFCTIGEGFGFIGSTILLLLYLILLFRIIVVAERQRSTFSRCTRLWRGGSIVFTLLLLE